MLTFTHLVFAIAVSKLLGLRTGTAMLAGTLPDFDRTLLFLTPITSAGVLHSIFAAFLFASASYIVSESRKTSYSFLAGYLCHLTLDFICIKGIMLFFPIIKFYSLGIVSGKGFISNMSVLSLSVALLVASRDVFNSKIKKKFS